MRFWWLAILLSLSASADKKILHVVKPLKVKPSAPIDGRAVTERLSSALLANDQKKVLAALGLPLAYENLNSEGCPLRSFGILHQRAELETFAQCLLKVDWIEDAAVVFSADPDRPFAIVINTNAGGKITDIKIPRLDPKQHGVVGGAVGPPIR